MDGDDARLQTVNQWGQTIDYAALNGKKKRRDGTYADSDALQERRVGVRKRTGADEDEVEDEEGADARC